MLCKDSIPHKNITIINILGYKKNICYYLKEEKL